MQRHNESRLSFEELYRYGYNLVLHKHGAKIYSGLIQLLTEEMGRFCSIILRTPSVRSPADA